MASFSNSAENVGDIPVFHHTAVAEPDRQHHISLFFRERSPNVIHRFHLLTQGHGYRCAEHHLVISLQVGTAVDHGFCIGRIYRFRVCSLHNIAHHGTCRLISGLTGLEVGVGRIGAGCQCLGGSGIFHTQTDAEGPDIFCHHPRRP